MDTIKRVLLLPLLVMLLAPLASHASVSIGVSINIAPPALPVYVQPPIPEPGYIWTPGYWAWGPEGYYWVPGTWVLPPRIGFLWTPGYWGWRGGFYVWNAGYWGPRVGFYGGINYGFGYGGVGYEGGYWRGDRLYYNRSVNNIGNANITNVYNMTIVNNTTVNRVSFNGGNGGIQRQPSGSELSALRERHIGYTSDQRTHEQAAARDRSFLASVNHGRPAIAVTQRPGVFNAAALPNRGPQSGYSGNRYPTNRYPAQSREAPQNRYPANAYPAPVRAVPQNRYPANAYPAPVRAVPQNRYPANAYPAPARESVRPQVQPQAQPRGPQPQERRGPEERDRR